jgi:hypothetical protein
MSPRAPTGDSSPRRATYGAKQSGSTPSLTKRCTQEPKHYGYES